MNNAHEFDDIFADAPPSVASLRASFNVQDAHVYLLAELMKLKPVAIQNGCAGYSEAMARVDYMRALLKLVREHVVGMAVDFNQNMPVTERQDVQSFNNILSDISMDLMDGFCGAAERLMEKT